MVGEWQKGRLSVRMDATLRDLKFGDENAIRKISVERRGYMRMSQEMKKPVKTVVFLFVSFIFKGLT